MDPMELRNSFAAFAGPDRYVKFIRALNRTNRWLGRLLFWQEEVLEQFAAATLSAELGFEQVESMLRIWELHGAELVPDLLGLSKRCRGARLREEEAERFPNTDCGPLVMGDPFENHRYGLWCCPACRDTEMEWEARDARSRIQPYEGAAMDAIADALVYAVSYINCRPLGDAESRYDDGDVGALESIAGFLYDATPAEEDALAAAAERALAAEQSSAQPRPEFVEDYACWMHDLFGAGWQDNRRVPVAE